MNKPDCEWCPSGHATTLFKDQVANQARKIDPDNEQDWYSLALGWALAQNWTIKGAHEFASHIRYHTELA